MTEITLTEGAGWSRSYRLTPNQLDLLRTADIVREKRIAPDMYQFRTREGNPLVGAARLGQGEAAVRLRIAPKIEIARLMFMVEYAHQANSARWQDADVAAREVPDLVPAIAHAFGRAAIRALSEGTLFGYRETEDAAMVVRGRVRVSDQIRRHYTFPVPLELSFDDYTSDISENRLLLTTARRLLRLEGISDVARSLLRGAIARLAGVTPIEDGEELPVWRPTRLNTRYHTALGLAELVLRGSSYELDSGEMVRVDGLLISMWQLFQDFVTVAIREALRQRQARGECRFQDSHHLDHARAIPLDPDLVYYQPSPAGLRPVAVADAKYAVIKGPRGHGNNLYQVVAYCMAMDVRRGYLVYAEGPASGPMAHRVGPNGLEITQYPLDLNRPPGELLAQVQALADRIAGL